MKTSMEQLSQATFVYKARIQYYQWLTAEIERKQLNLNKKKIHLFQRIDQLESELQALRKCRKPPS